VDKQFLVLCVVSGSAGNQLELVVRFTWNAGLLACL